ncbi:MAG: DNA methyltransferase [bacterium]|nr:DNA methyltransferase [bacterium]
MENTLYYGDNLDILRRYLKDETVDLVYLDPPFKSNQDYNVLFAEQNGSRAAAQIMAFEDTWHWDEAASRAYEDTIRTGGKVADVMTAFRTFLGGNDMLAYLSMMAPRLVELRRVLKPTGSIYLHCDPTASHYLKLLMDAVFGPQNFKNEITWQRTNAHNINAKYFQRVRDIILFYIKSDKYVWNQVYTEYSPEQMRRYHPDASGRMSTAQDLTMMSKTAKRNFIWRGARPPENRAWAVSREQLEQWWKEGRILTRKDGVPRLDGLKVYLDDMPGKRALDLWNDIERVGNTSAERLGYPTQKPEALLERIIKASSNEGDVVLDPFCGCGTAVAVAQKLNRQWIGIDITHLAITLIKKRLKDQFDAAGVGAHRDAPAIGKPDKGLNKGLDKGLKPLASTLKQGKGLQPLAEEPETDGRAQWSAPTYRVIGEPVALEDARELADKDKFQFQWWALGLVDARPVEQKKGADQGIDGRRYFIDGKDRHTEQVIFSVKGGHVNAAQVRDLRGVVEREKAAVGVFITLEEPTKPMKKEAADAGFYHSSFQDTKHPRLQIVTIEELLEGKSLDLPVLASMPSQDATFKKAAKVRRTKKGNESLDFD